MTNLQYKVKATACDYRESDEVVYEALKRAAMPLTESWKSCVLRRLLQLNLTRTSL